MVLVAGSLPRRCDFPQTGMWVARLEKNPDVHGVSWRGPDNAIAALERELSGEIVSR